MNTPFDPRTAGTLADRVSRLAESAAALASLGAEDPELADSCGVGLSSLEARMILGSGAPARVHAIARDAARMGRPASIPVQDLEALSRLEAVVSLGSSRIGLKLASLDAEAIQEPAARLGNIVSLASTAAGAFGFIRGLF